MEAKEKVLKTLQEAGQPLKSGEVAEKAGIAKAETDKIIKTLIKEERVISPKRCYYSPK